MSAFRQSQYRVLRAAVGADQAANKSFSQPDSVRPAGPECTAYRKPGQFDWVPVIDCFFCGEQVSARLIFFLSPASCQNTDCSEVHTQASRGPGRCSKLQIVICHAVESGKLFGEQQTDLYMLRAKRINDTKTCTTSSCEMFGFWTVNSHWLQDRFATERERGKRFATEFGLWEKLNLVRQQIWFCQLDSLKLFCGTSSL